MTEMEQVGVKSQETLECLEAGILAVVHDGNPQAKGDGLFRTRNFGQGSDECTEAVVSAADQAQCRQWL